MSELLKRLQAGTLALAGRDRETVRVGPFTAFVDHRRTLKFFSFAVPDRGVGAEAVTSLDAVAAAFSERRRTGRIELVDELTPALPAAIEAAGWSLSERVPIMVCTPDRSSPRRLPRASRSSCRTPSPRSTSSADGIGPWERLRG